MSDTMKKSSDKPLLKQKRYRTLFISLIIVNLIFAIIMSIFSYLFYYSASRQNMQKSFEDYQIKIQGESLSTIDTFVFQRLMDIPIAYFKPLSVENSLLYPQFANVHNDYSIIKEMSANLQTITQSYSFVSNVDIYYKASNVAITSSNNFHFDIKGEEIDTFLPWYSQYIATSSAYTFLPYDANSYPTSDKYITFVMKVGSIAIDDPPIYIALHIDPKNLTPYIDMDNGLFVMSRTSGDVIYASSNDMIPVMSDSYSNFSELDTSLQANNELVKIHYQSNLLDLDYYYYVPYDIFFQKYDPDTSFLMNSYIALLSFNVISILIITVIADRRYNKKVKASLKTTGIDLDSSTGVETSLEMVREKITALENIAEFSEAIIRRNVIRSLILGRNAGEEYEKIHQHFKHKNVACILADISKQKFATINMSEIQRQMEKMSVVPCQLFVTSMEINRLLVIALFDSTNKDTIIAQVADALLAFDPDCKLATGETQPVGRDTFHTAYQTALHTKSYRYIFPHTNHLDYHALAISHRNDKGSFIKIFANIEKSLTSMNYIDFKWNVSALIDTLKNGNYTIEYCHIILRDLISLFNNHVQKNNFDTMVIFGYDLHKHQKHIQDIDEYQDLICELCEVYLQNIRQRDNTIDTELKQQLIDYISSNLLNDISLEVMSDVFGMRSDTLSRTCKQLLGQSYIEYVRDLKLKKSIELIQDGMPIKDVGEKLGYNSTQYFIKIFKARYGATPYQYYKNQPNEAEK